jgi:hypothetical protein
MEKMLKPANGSAAPTKEIFSLLTLELWHREFMDNQPTSTGASGTAELHPKTETTIHA